MCTVAEGGRWGVCGLNWHGRERGGVSYEDAGKARNELTFHISSVPHTILAMDQHPNTIANITFIKTTRSWARLSEEFAGAVHAIASTVAGGLWPGKKEGARYIDNLLDAASCPLLSVQWWSEVLPD